MPASRVAEALSAFYRDLLFELGEHARRGGTAVGAAVVAKRVALEHGVDGAEGRPLPRPTRSEREASRDEVRYGRPNRLAIGSGLQPEADLGLFGYRATIDGGDDR